MAIDAKADFTGCFINTLTNYGFKDSPGLRYIAFIQFQLSSIIQNLSIPQVRGKLVTFLF